MSDHDGDEQWDIFLVSPKTGDVVNLTTSPDQSAEEEPTWSPDGRQIAYVTKPKTSSSYEVELMDVATRHVRHLTQEHAKGVEQRRPDFFARWQGLWSTRKPMPTTKDSNVFLLDLTSGKSTNLTPHEGDHDILCRDVSPDGKTLLHYFERAERLRQCRLAGRREQEDRVAHQTTSGVSPPEPFRPTASR